MVRRFIRSDTTSDEGEATKRKLKQVSKVRSPLVSLNSIEVAVANNEKKNAVPKHIPPAVEIALMEASDDQEERDHEYQCQGQEIDLAKCPYEPEDLKNFDLMNIGITIYGITGILCDEKEPKKKSKRKMSLTATKVKETKSNELTVDTCNDDEARDEPLIATTVAASVQRNGISSQTVLETFYPSQPMEIKSAPGVATDLSAMWQCPSAALLDSKQDLDDSESSFQMLRMMMKKPYSRGQSLVENYVHEHVQIGVNLCRGGELMRLGVATLIITGEEEGQVTMHVPVRSLANPGIQHSSRSRKKKASKKSKICFKNDNKMFRLDENASLCVGVQVNPRQDVVAANQYDEELEASDSQLLRAVHAARMTLRYMQKKRERDEREKKEKRIQCSDEERTLSHESYRSQTQDSKSKDTKTKKVEINPENMVSGIFCGAIPMMSGNDNNEVSTTNDSVAEMHSESKSKEEEIEVAQKPSLPMSEVLNVKYAPAYAQSFFSAITYSNTEVTDGPNQDFSDLVQQSVRQLALS